MSDHNIKKFVVPPLGGQCEIKDLKHHASPPEGGTTNFSNQTIS